jgi:hypothetical protein
MNLRLLSATLIVLFGGAAFGQRNQSVDPLERGDMVYLGPDASFACSAVTFFSNSNPCHVGMLTSSETVTEATSGVEPHAVHTLTLSTFQAAGYRSSMTTYPYTPSTAGRDTIVAYAAAKAARLSYYDANHFNQKGGYDGGCADGVAACWDGWDYFNEFDCVGLTERAYELAAAPDAEGPTPDYDPFDGCTWEGYFFIYRTVSGGSIPSTSRPASSPSPPPRHQARTSISISEHSDTCPRSPAIPAHRRAAPETNCALSTIRPPADGRSASMVTPTQRRHSTSRSRRAARRAP